MAAKRGIGWASEELFKCLQMAAKHGRLIVRGPSAVYFLASPFHNMLFTIYIIHVNCVWCQPNHHPALPGEFKYREGSIYCCLSLGTNIYYMLDSVFREE